MPAVKLSPLFNGQTVTSTGAPASGYKLYTYAAGSTTALAAYTDSSGTVAQANPIILNSSGSPANAIWLQSGLLYKFILKDTNDVQVGTPFDNISGVNDTSVSISQWLSSGVTPTYVSSTSFTLPGDQTAEFHVGRKVQLTVTAGTVYGTILTSAYSALTTVTLVMDSGSLDSGLSGVNLSILRADHLAVPPALLITSINGGPIGDLRNVIINGDMRVDQKNSGASQTFTAAAALAYCVDQWYGYCTGANITGQQTTISGQKRYRFTGAASNTAVGFGQRMEAASTSYLAGTTATLMAKLSSSSLTTITWALYYATSNDAFGTLASPTRTLINSGTFAINSTEANYSAQISIPSAATTGLELVLTGGALLATQTLTIGDVAIVPSSIGETNFPRRPYGMELALCQRFLPAFNSSSSNENVCTGHSVTATTFRMSFPFVVEPRVPPTGITVSSAGHFTILEVSSQTATALTFTTASKKACLMNGTVASGLTVGFASMLTCQATAGQILFTGCQL